MVFFTIDLGDVQNVEEFTEIQSVFNSFNNDVKLFLLKNAINQYKNIHNISIQNCESETINNINIENIKKINELKEEYEEKLNTLQFENYYLEKSLKDNKEAKALNTIIEQLKEDKKELSAEKIILQNRINQIENNNDDKIERFINKMTHSSATKGVIGENIIKNFLSQNFGLFDIIDTSGQTGKADLFFTNKTLNLLIENKNILSFKNDDFVKFYRDVENNVINKSINAALYISLYDVPFPNGRRGFFFERKFGIPIIMISNVYENMYSISYAVNTLLYLVENGFISNENNEDDEDQDFYLELSDFVTNLFTIYEKSMKFIENDRKNVLGLVKSLDERTENCNNLLYSLKNLTEKFPQFFNKNQTQNRDEIKEASIEKIVNALPKNFNITYNNLEKLGFKKEVVAPLGGTKVIKNAYKLVNPITLNQTQTQTVDQTVDQDQTQTQIQTQTKPKSKFIPFYWRKKKQI